MKKPFRLLDLPTEIRDKIYHEILCTWPAYKSTWDEAKQQAVVPTEVAVMNRKIETAILRTNKQVYQEAKTVLLRGNQFIRVSIKGFRPLQFLFIPSQVPVVTMNQDAITKYRGFVMTHSIDITDDPAPLKGQFEVMILRRDLDRFAAALSKGDISSPNFTATSKHTVTLHNPFVGTFTPNFLDSKNQERLLAPYRKHLHSFKNFKIDGKVKAEIANTVSTEIRQERIPDPQELLEDIKRQKDLGNKHYLEGDMVKCSDDWCGALLQIHRLAKSHVWSRVKAAGGKPFTDKITELFFQLNMNEMQGTIKVMQQSTPQDRAEYADGVYEAGQSASMASQVLGTDWKPNLEQRAKLAYRLAMTHRLADDDKRVAQQMITLAAGACPEDPAIQREKEAIRRWVSGR
ncbi:hypothetical protein ZTR_04914 [Talaromyces verruculosus]|nr:hypothetical protein ZTR_04914 [Talaromyces verruculosus]